MTREDIEKLTADITAPVREIVRWKDPEGWEVWVRAVPIYICKVFGMSEEITTVFQNAMNEWDEEGQFKRNEMPDRGRLQLNKLVGGMEDE